MTRAADASALKAIPANRAATTALQRPANDKYIYGSSSQGTFGLPGVVQSTEHQ